MLDRQRRVGGNDINCVGLDRCQVFGLDHRHCGDFAEDLGKHALVIGSKVLDQNERHAAISGHVFKKASVCHKTAGGGPNANRQEQLSPFRLGLIFGRFDGFTCSRAYLPGKGLLSERRAVL